MGHDEAFVLSGEVLIWDNDNWRNITIVSTILDMTEVGVEVRELIQGDNIKKEKFWHKQDYLLYTLGPQQRNSISGRKQET